MPYTEKVNCLECGTGIVIKIARDLSRKKYCSNSCRLKGLHSARNHPSSCEVCGGEYSARSNRQKYCKECIPDQAARQRYNSYGVDQVMFDAMYFEQDGECAICEKAEACRVDHCHETGKVRALLCNKCNVALHHIETPGWTEKAQAYVTIF